QRARAGEQVQAIAAGQVEIQPVEQGFAGSGRAGAHAAGIRKAELTAAPVATDNAQLALSAGPGGARGGVALRWSALGHGAAPVGETVSRFGPICYRKARSRG